MFDGVVVIDESIVRVGSVAVAVRNQSWQRSSAGQRFVLLVVQSVDEVIWTDHMGGYIPIQVDWNVVQLGRVTCNLFSGGSPGSFYC